MPRSNASFLGQLLGTSQKITTSALDDAVSASLSGALQPDGDGSQLTGLPDGYTDSAVISYLASAGNIVVGGTVDGRDISADGAILDGNATAIIRKSFAMSLLFRG